MSDPLSLGMAGIGAATNAFNLLKGFVDLRDAAKVQALKFELMGLLLEAQESQATLVAEKRQLEERLRELEAWDGEAERYELADLGRGSLAFVVKPEAKGSHPFHMLCPRCYQHRRKSYLQRMPNPVGGYRAWSCPECKTQVTATGPRIEALSGEEA